MARWEIVDWFGRGAGGGGKLRAWDAMDEWLVILLMLLGDGNDKEVPRGEDKVRVVSRRYFKTFLTSAISKVEKGDKSNFLGLIKVLGAE